MGIQWALVLFTVLAGAGAWLFLLNGLNVFLVRVASDKVDVVASVASLALLIIGGLASLMHLSHPSRVLGALSHPTSGIFTEALLLGLLVVVIVAYIVLCRRKASHGAVKVVALLGMVLAVALSFAVGNSYIMSSRPAWDTITLPLAYLGTASTTGASLYLLIAAAAGKPGDTGFPCLAAVATAALSALTAMGYGMVSGALWGTLALPFWACVVFLGAVIPATIGYLYRKRTEGVIIPAILAVCAAFVGSIAFRCIMWSLGIGIADFFTVL